MAEDEKMFTCVKSGMNIKISPRNAAGWRALGWWMLAMALLTGGFIWLIQQNPDGPQMPLYVTIYALLMTAWAIAMTRWMYLRSEVIDVKELLAIKRELERQKRGRR